MVSICEHGANVNTVQTSTRFRSEHGSEVNTVQM